MGTEEEEDMALMVEFAEETADGEEEEESDIEYEDLGVEPSRASPCKRKRTEQGEGDSRDQQARNDKEVLAVLPVGLLAGLVRLVGVNDAADLATAARAHEASGEATADLALGVSQHRCLLEHPAPHGSCIS